MPGLIARGLGCVAPALAAPPPNIVFILIDDQRWDTRTTTRSSSGVVRA